MTLTGRLIAAALLGACCSLAAAEGIYSCVDAKGRRLTADRPIAECIDREQSELNPSGSVKRKLPPSLTADERARQDELARQQSEERSRVAEEKKRNRALVVRYPDKASHDKERAAALAVVDDVIAHANRRIKELQAERQKTDLELEFYKKDPTKIPPRLKRQIEENEQSMEAQQRFLANQAGEKQRINARFDEELAVLRQLWTVAPPAAPPSAVAAKRQPR